jgi:hypothetical protein
MTWYDADKPSQNIMAAKAPVFEEKVKRAIRDAMALDPIITRTALKERLDRMFKYSFDRQYLGRLTDKVMRQAQSETDRSKIAERITSLRETHRIARERSLRILYWSPDNQLPGIKPPLPQDILEAAKNLVMLDIAVLNAEVANGIYASESEAAEGMRYAPMAPEHRQVVIAAFTRWGMLPKAQAETIVGPALQILDGNHTTQPVVG